MDSNTKQLMAVFSLMLGLSWGIPYIVSEPEDRNSGWIMLAVFFLLIALGLYFWIMREQRTAEDAANEALDAAEENLKKIEAQAAQAEAEKEPVPVHERDLPPQQAAPDVSLPQTASATQIEEALAEETEEDASSDEDGDEEIEIEVKTVEAEPEPEPVAEEASDEPDDLERIEGIGPKYAEILTGAGVNTFEQIAAMSEDEIVDLIKSNGGRKSASMATWAEQAKLAAANDWDGLDKLQDELSGGRR